MPRLGGGGIEAEGGLELGRSVVDGGPFSARAAAALHRRRGEPGLSVNARSYQEMASSIRPSSWRSWARLLEIMPMRGASRSASR